MDKLIVAFFLFIFFTSRVEHKYFHFHSIYTTGISVRVRVRHILSMRLVLYHGMGICAFSYQFLHMDGSELPPSVERL